MINPNDILDLEYSAFRVGQYAFSIYDRVVHLHYNAESGLVYIGSYSTLHNEISLDDFVRDFHNHINKNIAWSVK